MLTSAEIRQQFIDHFVKKHDHLYVPSSPVVPHDDPTLLFTNAGMNQFKPYFLGSAKPVKPRAANTQKCIRAGGKHNDLDDVGKDTYHHTFFEMLGNWSFGDYFKKESIAWAWDLIVNTWKLDPTRLHATYFRGDPAEKLEPDTEARDLWRQLLPAERVHPGNKKDNFWEMGDTGPCGPCSEIHVDLTPDQTGGNLVNAGDARVMEIWNLVFIQFNRTPGGLNPLPAKHVDTGMGFERICSVIQHAGSNYDTDVFTPIFRGIQSVTRARPYGRQLDDAIDTAYRIIADHIRCLTFALTDGAAPGNEGRDYVLRRILRRAVRHGRQTLNVKHPFLHELVPGVVEAMGQAFPELQKNPQRVIDLIKDEEESFSRTIDRGIAHFDAACGLAHDQRRISAADAFKLHDTFGFPLDLTQVMAQERGLTVDVEGFETLMEQARQQSRAGAGDDAGLDLAHELLNIVQKTNPPATRFLGYDSLTAQAKVLGIHPVGACWLIVTDQTPFYAQAGGQVGDTGVIDSLPITDTQKAADVIFHLAASAPAFNVGQTVTLEVSVKLRSRTMANHTTTHVLNHKLRGVLGDHVMQKGSLVDPDKLRFDFAHNTAMSDEELARVERLVNDDIAADLPVYAQVAPQENALKIHGLRAVFGEKYPPHVRVVSIGVTPEELLQKPAEKQWYDYSVEFCGGTHIKKTGDAEGFVVIAEEAVGKGVRRILGLTGDLAAAAHANATILLGRVEAHRGDRDEQLPSAVAELSKAVSEQTLPLLAKAQLRHAIEELQQRVRAFEKQQSQASAGAAIDQARALIEAADQDVMVLRLDHADADALRAVADMAIKKKPNGAVLLASANEQGVALVAKVSPALIAKGLKAGDWVREAARVVGGKGGGRPDMAQAGGKDVDKLPQALEAARAFVEAKT